MWFVEDNFQWCEVNPGNIVSRVSRKGEGENFTSHSPYFHRVIFAAIEEVFHSFNFLASEAGWFRSHTRFERFVLCPDGAVENLEGCLLGLGRKQGHGKNFVCIEESIPPGGSLAVMLDQGLAKKTQAN